MKFLYDNYDSKRNIPYPNLWDKTLIDYFSNKDGDYMIANDNKFQFRTLHSNIWWYHSSDIKNHEYIQNVKENDEKYISLYVESMMQCPNWKSKENNDEPYYLSVSHTKEMMKKNQFFETAHPTYYYWKKFVEEIMISWNLF